MSSLGSDHRESENLLLYKLDGYKAAKESQVEEVGSNMYDIGIKH